MYIVHVDINFCIYIDTLLRILISNQVQYHQQYGYRFDSYFTRKRACMCASKHVLFVNVRSSFGRPTDTDKYSSIITYKSN